MKQETITIDGKKFVYYNKSDLRFTGWEHECIIIDRTENKYIIPLDRYKELQAADKRQESRNKKPHKIPPNCGVAGTTGVVGSPSGGCPSGINIDKYNDALTGITCMLTDNNEIVIYHVDIENALRCGMENRDLTLFEFD